MDRSKSEKWSTLSEKISHYPHMHLGKFAAGSASGQKASLNIASNGQSSSLLPFGTHTNNHPSITYTQKVLVDLRTVDEWISELEVNTAAFNFINLDIQGYELMRCKA